MTQISTLTFIVTTISTAVDKAIPKAKSVRSESNPISDETIALIKEKRRLRRHHSQNKDPAIKTRINQLQKQVKEELKLESLVSWEKFYNSISQETNSNESCRWLDEDLHRWVKVDQAEGLCHCNHLTFW